ncbi:MAG: rod shape-determining protein RodA [Clostridia bacterium]|nr:rod shape-determining protein RodA [Clostridia bacterium]
MNTASILSRKERQHIDIPLILVTLAMATFGVVAVTAATYSYTTAQLPVDNWFARVTSSYYGSRQGLFLLVSPFAIAGMAAVDYRVFQKFSLTIYVASVLLLLLVLAIGVTTSGVTGWFMLFTTYMIQPSEFAKIGIILHLAWFFSRKDNPVSTFRDFMRMAGIMGLPLLMIFAQGELGTVIVFLVIYIAMMLFSGMKLRIIGGLVLFGVAVLIPVVVLMRESGSYRYERLLSFFDPSMASSDAIYQARNSQIAIGNGGLNGTGMFTNGNYTALKFVPANQTDFIFSTIGETTGFTGSMIIIGFYLYMFYRMLALAMHTHDKFGRLVIIGVFAKIFFHTYYNIGMTVGVTPVMGIPLPFLSYGGSNLIANMAGIGLIINITYRKPIQRSGEIGAGPGDSLRVLGKRKRLQALR